MVLTCMWTTPSGDALFNDHPFGTFDAGSGRRPPHQSRRFDCVPPTSALPPSTDIVRSARQVRFVPTTEVDSSEEAANRGGLYYLSVSGSWSASFET
jgi:hypothetical protein